MDSFCKETYKMNYEEWRSELFGQPPDIDPVSLEHSSEFYSLSPNQAFDFVDLMLLDRELHSLFSKEQIGNAINTVYSNCCSNLPFLYTTECDEERRVKGIRHLINLYRNFFERYCTARVVSIGNDQTDGRIGFICYMFWDVFVLYPGSASPPMKSAAIGVMRAALDSRNDNCLASAIHGLGHWAMDVPDASVILKQWLRRPTTTNPQIVQYARTATSGMIL
jgi:hypothetical protein